MQVEPSIIVGIDPGQTGAIAFLDTFGSIDVHDMPTYPNKKGKTDLNLYEIGSILKPRTGGRRIAVIEQVHAMPKQGISSAFRFGEGYGALQMALMGHGYELNYVTPTQWKRHFGLNRNKGLSRGLATQRFPGSASSFTRVKDDGRAEASLIALYGAEKIFPAHFQSFNP